MLLAPTTHSGACVSSLRRYFQLSNCYTQNDTRAHNKIQLAAKSHLHIKDKPTKLTLMGKFNLLVVRQKSIENLSSQILVAQNKFRPLETKQVAADNATLLAWNTFSCQQASEQRQAASRVEFFRLKSGAIGHIFDWTRTERLHRSRADALWPDCVRSASWPRLATSWPKHLERARNIKRASEQPKTTTTWQFISTRSNLVRLDWADTQAAKSDAIARGLEARSHSSCSYIFICCNNIYCRFSCLAIHDVQSRGGIIEAKAAPRPPILVSGGPSTAPQEQISLSKNACKLSALS